MLISWQKILLEFTRFFNEVNRQLNIISLHYMDPAFGFKLCRGP